MYPYITILAIGGIFILTGILLLIGKHLLFHRISERASRCTATAWAAVTEMRPVEDHTIIHGKHHHSVSYHRVFEFRTADGKIVQVVSPSGMYYQEAFKVETSNGGKTLITQADETQDGDLSNKLHREIGWQTQIRYDPEDPEVFVDPGGNETTAKIGSLFISAAAACCIVPGILLLITGAFLASIS